MNSRTHSKIEALPQEVREKVETKLLEGNTYEDISNSLKEEGFDVHYSSVGRYGRKYLKKFEAVKIARQFAKLIAEDDIDRPPTELHEANNLIINQLLMETILDENIDAKGLSNVAKAISSLQSAQIQNENLKIRARKEAGAIHSAMNMLKEKVFDEIAASHPDIANTLILLAEEVEKESQSY